MGMKYKYARIIAKTIIKRCCSRERHILSQEQNNRNKADYSRKANPRDMLVKDKICLPCGLK